MKKDTLSDAVTAVRASAKRLNAVTDRAAETVRAVEEFLERECSIGVAASVRVSTATTEEASGQTWSSWTDLWYCRIGDRFRIAVAEGAEWLEEEGDTVKPWSDCKRDVKLLTIDKLPALLAKIAQEANEKADEAEASLDDVLKVIAPARK